ncbi:MAG: hypothetical protein ACHQ6T_02810 [Myxococcota bacterium]
MSANALAAILLAARLADVVSTRIATPRLQLEANPVVRLLGWRFAWATLLVCFVAYIPDYGPSLAVPLIVISFLVASSNLSRGWAMRALGEDAYQEHSLRVASLAVPLHVYLMIAASGALTAGVGALLLVFYPEPTEWAYQFGVGIIGYALAVWFYSTLGVRRLFRAVANASRT